MQKRWQVVGRRQKAEDKKQRAEPGWVVEQILKNRGIKKENWEDFLAVPAQPPLKKLTNLFDQKELVKVVDQVKKAVFQNEPIIIHGDYDVDGLCATAILWELVYYGLGYQNAHPFIPHRTRHGYGLSQSSIDEIQSQFTTSEKKLLVAVDCGITAEKEVEYAKSLGFDVLILDHHVLPKSPPAAAAILHSTDLCAAGISWVLSACLTGSSSPASARRLPHQTQLQLVALATIADLQPLLGLNRQLVQLGLRELGQTTRIGLQELVKSAGVSSRQIGSYEAGFILGPRLNAVGRLEHALSALRLLCTQNRVQAQKLARHLNLVNQKRQSLTSSALKTATQQALAMQKSNPAPAPLILWHQDWHEGIIGLIAAKMVETFYRPVIVLSQGEKYSKASARSIAGFNVVEAIRSCEDLLVDVGGHEMAAGFTIETAKLKQFAKQFTQKAALSASQQRRAPVLLIDLEIPLRLVSWELLTALGRLAPHGIGNPRPVFLTRDLVIDALRWVGKENQHLRLVVRPVGGGAGFSAIGFNLLEKFGDLQAGETIDLVYTLSENEFNGECQIQLKIKDLSRQRVEGGG